MMTSSLRNTLRVAATVYLYDDANGVFGELIPPEVVLSSLAYDENVGNIGDPASAQAVTSFHSITYEGKELALEIDNITSTHKVRIRWMNEHGHNPLTHVWTVGPSSTFVQYTRPGHLFLLTALVGQDELILGAYRPVRPLPSGSPHCILIQQQRDVADAFLLELLLGDTEDSLMVAASALDPAGFADKKTVPMLHTIVTNLMQRPWDEKYHRLRLSNRTIQRHIASAWGAMQLLYLLGFQITELAEEESKESEAGAEEYLVFPTKLTEAQLAIFQRAKEMLELLRTRADPHFVAELAAPPPWQTPLLSTGGALASHWNSRGTHFITPDERWQRTERFQAHRGGRPRRPSPGNAPSSRGKWGR
jgi:PUB domain